MGGPPNPCQTPGTPCWCQSHPNHPQCTGGCWPPGKCIPIDGGLEFLALAGVLLILSRKKILKKVSQFI